MAKFERIVLGTTEIDISGIVVEVTIVRNENGTLERLIKDEEVHFPDGVTTEGYNDEIQFCKFQH